MKKQLLFLLFFLVANEVTYSQDIQEQGDNKPKFQVTPAIGVGIGLSKFMGDIEDHAGTNVHRLGNKLCYNGSFRINISRSFYISADALFGRVSGNEDSDNSHRNFEAKMINAGANIEYNFKGLYKKKKAVVTPFIGAGFYYSNFKASTDLLDANGQLYYYWSDGKIRNMPEDSPDADLAERVSRDYVYETSLNSKPVSTFSIPVSGGLDFHISPRFVFRLSSKYFFVFSDKVDQFNAKPHSAFNDGFFYSSGSVFFNLIPDRSGYLPKEILWELDHEDYDADGVPDVQDECGGTTKGVTVNEKGCAIDTDNDGIPDYLDGEPNSPTIEVDNFGVVFDYLKIAQNAADSFAIIHALLAKYPNLFLKSGDLNYTVHAGTFSEKMYRQRQFLQSIPGIKEKQLNDSLFVYYVGDYTKFEQAQEKKTELELKGIESAFEVPEKELTNVVADLNKLAKDTLISPQERKKYQDEQFMAAQKEKDKNFSEGKSFAAVSTTHSEEKKDFSELDKKVAETTIAKAVVEEDKRKEDVVEKVEIVEEKVTAAIGTVEEEQRKEESSEEIKSVSEKKSDEKPAVAEKENKPKDVVKFSVDVIEHLDNPLPYDVLIVMQREKLTMQTARVLGGAKIYTVGLYDSVKEAEKIQKEISGLGANDVKIIGSINNIKVTQKEAEDLLKKISQ